MDDERDDEESTCGQPCNPAAGCDECASYWERMIEEGYWDRERAMWTDKGWREVMKGF